jgi:hypothetical protein
LAIETVNPFLSLRDGAFVRHAGLTGIDLGKKIGDEYSAISDRRPGIASGYRLPPQDRWPLNGELLDDSLFAPDGITPGTQPLRPVVGT